MYFARQALATVNRAACVTLTMYCLTDINRLVKRKVLTMAEENKQMACAPNIEEKLKEEHERNMILEAQMEVVRLIFGGSRNG